ncbi:PRC-barrel domain-containing protein [Virgifigura deserti]|uniref:PRC-barrel domain-containing protein n=1 Tax=Virgifigura deserti TaxID=2268457 RepID=UPI003CCC2257
MLWWASEMTGYGILTTDGSIGSIDDLLFEDESWAIRWAVIDTGTWLSGRKVLLPPSCFGRAATGLQHFPVELTRQQIKDSPDVDTDRPVSRQTEFDLFGHYGWAPYWAAGYVPPAGMTGGATPPAGVAVPGIGRSYDAPEPSGDPHLHSAKEIAGYRIHATDGEIGHVEDVLVDDENWIVRYAIVDTRNWWPGRKVLISPQWIREVNWEDRLLQVDLTRQAVKDSPEYDPSMTIDRAYEERLHRYYDRPRYWV